MEIRPATVEDAEAIETIRIRGWRRAYRHVFPPEALDGLPIDGSRWREALAGGWEQVCFVCEEADRMLGWVTVGAGEVKGIYVDPDAWTRGAGRALLRRAEQEIAPAYDEGVLWVLEANERARRFYERCGWAFDGGRGRFDRFGVSAPTVRYTKSFTADRRR